MLLKKVIFFLATISVANIAIAQTVDEVIAGYIKFIGGEQRWKAVNTIITSGTYNYGGIEFPFQSFSKRPDNYKFVVPFKGKYFAQAYDGEKGWKIDAFKNETKKTYLTGKPALAMSNEADVELETPFINLEIKGHKAMLAGTDTVNGTPCFKVKLERKNGETELYSFSNDTYALVKKLAVSKNAELESALLETFYSDYNKVQGINIPFISESKTGGQSVLIINVKKIEINVAVPASTFNE